MQITATALSLNVDDPDASAAFLVDHFGFAVRMSADGFVSVAHPDSGLDIAYLRTGLPSFRPVHMQGHRADGLLLAFVVPEVDAEHPASAGSPG